MSPMLQLPCSFHSCCSSSLPTLIMLTTTANKQVQLLKASEINSQKGYRGRFSGLDSQGKFQTFNKISDCTSCLATAVCFRLAKACIQWKFSASCQLAKWETPSPAVLQTLVCTCAKASAAGVFRKDYVTWLKQSCISVAILFTHLCSPVPLAAPAEHSLLFLQVRFWNLCWWGSHCVL